MQHWLTVKQLLICLHLFIICNQCWHWKRGPLKAFNLKSPALSFSASLLHIVWSKKVFGIGQSVPKMNILWHQFVCIWEQKDSTSMVFSLGFLPVCVTSCVHQPKDSPECWSFFLKVPCGSSPKRQLETADADFWSTKPSRKIKHCQPLISDDKQNLKKPFKNSESWFLNILISADQLVSLWLCNVLRRTSDVIMALYDTSGLIHWIHQWRENSKIPRGRGSELFCWVT